MSETIYWSQSSSGFFSSALHSVIPDDAVEITPAKHGEMLAALNGGGKVIAVADGLPIISDAPIAAVTPDSLKEYAAGKRYAVETGGITVGGTSIDTSRASQAMLSGVYAYVQANPEASISFKAVSGWMTLTAAQAIEITGAVGVHVQAAFEAERALDVAIDAGAITSKAEIDAWSWPNVGAN